MRRYAAWLYAISWLCCPAAVVVDSWVCWSYAKGHRQTIRRRLQQQHKSLSASPISVQSANSSTFTTPTTYGLSDSEFLEWLQSELFQDPLYQEYPALFHQAALAITKWRQRYRGNPQLWQRLFKKDRVFKEFIEAVPILNAVTSLVNDSHETNMTIIDLASGKGYLSMFLSEMLPPSKIHGIVLMDKSWPRQNQPLQSHHINWDHIYGTKPTTNHYNNNTAASSSYYHTWPIPLVTSKQDLKQPSTHRSLQKKYFKKAPDPILLLAVHLCGTLSLRAVEMFNANPQIQFLALKPCCLPPMVHAQREETFVIQGCNANNQHSFMASQVCSNGRFNGKQWYGPPRWHLQPKFERWAEHLFFGVDIDNHDDDLTTSRTGKKGRVQVTVQRDGGYQNAFIFAQRHPVSESVWKSLQKNQVSSFLGSETRSYSYTAQNGP